MHLRCRPWFSAIAVVGLALPCAVSYAAPVPVLSIDPAVLAGTDRVTFKVFAPDEVGHDTQHFNPAFTVTTNDGQYSIFFDPGTLTYTPACQCFLFEIVARSSNPGDPTYVYSGKAEPNGRFADTIVPVTLKIGLPGRPVSTTEIQMPLHSPGFRDALQIVPAPEQSFLRVSLSSHRVPSIHIKNTLDKFAVHVTRIEMGPTCDQCWSPPGPQTPTVIPAGADVDIFLNRQPRLFPALFATAFILKKDAAADTVTTRVYYEVEQGGVPKDSSWPVRVRFTPSLWQLLLAVLIGALAGTLLRWWLDPAYSKITPKLALQCLVLAGVAEFIAVVMASYDSRLVLLGVDMDPQQFVPAIVLAGLVAGGPIVAKWIASIPGLKPPGGGEPAPHPQGNEPAGQPAHEPAANEPVPAGAAAPGTGGH